MSAAQYRYTARDAAGELVRGSMEAPSVEAVLASLRTRALFVTAVDRETLLARTAGRSLRIGAPPRRALLAFFRSFSTLIRAGVPMRRALDVTIERASDAGLRESLRSVLADVEHGTALSAAMERRPRAFAPLYVAMVRAGEAGGILDDVLERLATFLERDAELRKKVRAALAYPAVVVSAALGLVLFLMARIVPMFAQMFDAFHAELPATTRALLAVGDALQRPPAWIASAAVIVLAGGTLAAAVRTQRGALALDRLRLRLPVFGPLLHKTITARIARMLATLLRSGIDLVTAIEVVRPVAGSPAYAAALARVDVALRAGDALTVPLEAARLFDPLAVALVRVGEETGLLDEMLLKVASYFETDVEAAIATLGAVIEPALIGVLGCVVGFIVFSVFIPLYALIGERFEMTQQEHAITRYGAERTVERRNAVVDAHRYLCARGARKFKRANNDRADLEQVAAVGLIKAATNYRAEMQTPFQAYAWIMIVGELMHYVRDHERMVRAPRTLLALEKRYIAAWDAFTVRHHREPSNGEMAAALGVTVETVNELRNLRRVEHVPLPDAESDNGPERVELLADTSIGIELEERVALAMAVDELGERERTVVLGTYGAGLTQSEIGARLGLSQSHVSKLLSRALGKLSRRVA